MPQVITSHCSIHRGKVILNDELVFYEENFANFADFIKGLFKKEQIAYPKFYKMDGLSKLGFLSVELLLKNKTLSQYPPEEIAIVLCNAAASLDTDLLHQESISDRASYFPSPSVFVYTLPNIMIGEICIRHKIKGENLFLVTETFDPEHIYAQVDEIFRLKRASAVITGWVDLLATGYHSMVCLVEEDGATGGLPFTAAGMKKIFDSI